MYTENKKIKQFSLLLAKLNQRNKENKEKKTFECAQIRKKRSDQREDQQKIKRRCQRACIIMKLKN